VKFTAEHKSAFERDGYVIVRGLFSSEQIAAALEEVDKLTYGSSFADYLCERENGAATKAPVGRSQFPTGVSTLDSFLENEDYLDCFAGCVGTPSMSYCNGHLFVRSGPDDARHAPELWQGYHIDDGTCNFLPPSPNISQYHYVNSSIMLHDIEEDGAPLHIIPGSHTQLKGLMPELVESGKAVGGNFVDIREVPAFVKPIPVTGKAGDTLFYSSYLVHAAVPFANKKKQRSLWTVTMARDENSSFTRYSNPYQPSEREHINAFWTQTSPRVRSLFGWPAPGDPYYTDETLRLLANLFPGMDLTPYRNAIIDS
jgi:ectoine hydroxylase-related dioxygenase (phytanoyl-CoA dioxygenase family)